MAINQIFENSSGMGVMQRLTRSLSGNGSASNVDKMSEESALSAAAEVIHSNIAGTSRGEDTAAGPSPALEEDQSIFSNVLDKLKNFKFGMITPTPKEIPDQNLTGSSASSQVRSGDPTTDTQLPDSSVEPIHLASRIQSLLKALSLPSHSTPKPARHPKRLQRDDDGRPIPPHGVDHIHDAELVTMLHSATVMNGGRHRDDVRERRVSVWSVLESLGDEGGEDGNGVSGNDGGGGDDSRSGEHDVGNASGIMMYSPLMPTNLSLVEIAESGIFNAEEQEDQIVDPISETAQVAGWMGMWPFSAWSTGPAVESGGHHPNGSPAPSTATSLPSSPRGRSARLSAQAKKRVWIPSTTNLSFQAVWWGYRIYLPPPAMDILGDRSMEYAKRAAMITTALTWFFSNLPLTALPAPMRPAVLLLQTLIPYIGYIGSLISWSWGTIQSYDTGHGVILTATWLLPIALIPGTWEAEDFPPPSPPSPLSQPLPSFGPSPSSSTPQLSPIASLPTPPTTPPSTAYRTAYPQSEIPVQLPAQQVLSPAQSFVTAPMSPFQSPLASGGTVSSHLPFVSPVLSPAHSPNVNTLNIDTNVLSPIQLISPYPSPSSTALLRASEPLPSWVPPPPPPSIPTVPLPEVDEVGTPRFRIKVLGKIKASRSKEGGKTDERKEGKGKGRLKAIAGALGGRKDDGLKGLSTP